MPARDLNGLVALRDRVRAATGADRELDARLYCSTLDLRGCRYPSAEKWVRAAIEQNWNTPLLTFSTDAAIALIEGDPAYKADPEGFMRRCAASAEMPETWDYSRPAAPQIARHMLLGYLSALITSEAPDADAR